MKSGRRKSDIQGAEEMWQGWLAGRISSVPPRGLIKEIGSIAVCLLCRRGSLWCQSAGSFKHSGTLLDKESWCRGQSFCRVLTKSGSRAERSIYLDPYWLIRGITQRMRSLTQDLSGVCDPSRDCCVAVPETCCHSLMFLRPQFPSLLPTGSLALSALTTLL